MEAFCRDEKGQPQATDPAKKLRNLKKKLRDIEALEAKVSALRTVRYWYVGTVPYWYGTYEYVPRYLGTVPVLQRAAFKATEKLEHKL